MMTNDKDIIYAMREDAERGFRLLMLSYKEPLYGAAGMKHRGTNRNR
jgi:hypothetical protein